MNFTCYIDKNSSVDVCQSACTGPLLRQRSALQLFGQNERR